MNMTKKLTVVCCIVIGLSLLCAAIAFLVLPGGGVTLVKSPAQTKVSRPAGFPDPEANWIQLPESVNLAAGKPVRAGEVTEVYTASNVTDGDTNTYWESKGVPAEIVVDLGGAYKIKTVAVRLNPAALWEARTQGVEVLVSADGETFTSVAAAAKYDFNPDTGNIIRIDFKSAPANFVKLIFSSNSSARSAGAQAAEILVFE